MKWIVFIGLFVITPFSYSDDSMHTRLVLGGAVGCSDCVDLDLKSLNLDFDPGLLTGQSVQVVLEKEGVAGYMIRGQMTDKGFVITLFGGLSSGLNKDSSLRMSIRTNLGHTISDQVSIKQIHTVGRHDIAFLKPDVFCREHENEDCKEICNDIYGDISRNDREKCEHLPYSVVQSLWKVHEIFKNPQVENLELMDPVAFSSYIKMGIKPLEDLIKSEYSVTEVYTVLIWLAWSPLDAKDLPEGLSEERIPPDVNMLFQADEDFDILDALLKQVMFSDKDVKDLLKRHPYVKHLGLSSTEEFLMGYLDTEKQFLWYSFFVRVTENNNEKAGEWVHRFIEKRDCKSNNAENKKWCVLKTYCKFSEIMSDEVAHKLMDFPYFQKFIDEIITEGINKPQWSWPDFESYKALNLWHRDLCGNITQ